jgi:Family of unknown function (DUF6480)
MRPTTSVAGGSHRTVPWNHLPDEGLEVPEDSLQAAGHSPPAESGVTALDAPEREALRHGWGWGPIAAIMIVVAIFIAGAIGMAVELAL